MVKTITKKKASNTTSTRKGTTVSTNRATTKMKGAAGASKPPKTVARPSGGTKPKGGGKKGC